MLQPVFDNDYMPRIAEVRLARALVSGRRTRRPRAAPPGLGTATIWPRFPSTERPKANSGCDTITECRPISSGSKSRARSGACPRPAVDHRFHRLRHGQDADATPIRRGHPGPDPDGLGLHWVGDLAVECTAEVESPSGALAFELRKGGRRFQCRFDLSTGKATLSISGQDMADWQPTASTSVRGQGRHKIIFSNCDDELRLWVDGSWSRSTSRRRTPRFEEYAARRRRLGAGGHGLGGRAVRISHLRVLRDIYYIAGSTGTSMRARRLVSVRRGLARQAMRRRSDLPRYVDFSLEKDQFFVLGDNSAKSKDGRLWGPEYWVPRDLLIGKAMFIYWPHSWDRIPYVNIPFPYFPNFSRMRLVR